MSNKNSPAKMSTYTNYLGQILNKTFNKATQRQVNICKNITYCHYHTITLCHVKFIKFNCLLIS